MIFPTSEGLNLAPLLRRLFQTPWTGSAYYRTTWGAKAGSAPLLALCFPGFAASRQYSAKACSLRNVPFEDRVLGVTASSQHESLSMMLSGAVAGLIGMTELAETGKFPPDPIQGLGFQGIGVALLGRNNPGGMAFAALVFAFLDVSSGVLDSTGAASREIAVIMQGIVLITAVVAYGVANRFRERDEAREAAEALTEEALERGSSDNVTIVVACFQH